MGARDFNLSDDEKLYRGKAMKKILTKRAMRKGEVISLDDIILKRTPKLTPLEGIHDPKDVIGLTLKADMDLQQPLLKENLA